MIRWNGHLILAVREASGHQKGHEASYAPMARPLPEFGAET